MDGNRIQIQAVQFNCTMFCHVTVVYNDMLCYVTVPPTLVLFSVLTLCVNKQKKLTASILIIIKQR